MLFKSSPFMRGINPALWCIDDKWQQALINSNRVVESIPAMRRALIIMSSLMIDFTFLHGAILWFFYGKSGDLLWKLIIFYGMRALCQQIFFFKFTAGFMWKSPGFPSLFVPYDKTSDFYFSGHTGILVIFVWNNITHNRIFLGLFILFFALYMIPILMIYQVHYSIDCPIGILAATYSFLLVYGREKTLDRWMRKHTIDYMRPLLEGWIYSTGPSPSSPQRRNTDSIDSDL